MSDPLVSIIIPAYQASKTITRTLDSITAQTGFTDYEAIVVNDHSTDDTSNLIMLASQKNHRIREINLDVNLGPAGARNIGIKASTGKLIAFLDHDDQWLPQKLSYQVNIFNTIPEADLVFTDGYNVVITNRGAQQSRLLEINNSFKRSLKLKQTLFFKDVYEISGQLQRTLYSKCFIAPSTVMVKRACIEKVKGFNPKRFGTEDIDLWVRLAYFARFYYWTEPVIIRNVEDRSFSKISERRLLELIDYNKMCLTSDDYKELRDISRKNLEKFYRYLIIFHGQNGNRKKVFETLKTSKSIGFMPKLAFYAWLSILGRFPYIVGPMILNRLHGRNR